MGPPDAAVSSSPSSAAVHPDLTPAQQAMDHGGRRPGLGGRVPGHLRRQPGAAPHRRGTVVGPAGRARGAVLRGLRLLRHAQRPADPGGRPHRLPRPEEDVLLRPRRLRCHIAALRPRTIDRVPDRGTRAAGRRRSVRRPRIPVDHHRHLRRGGARARLRHLGRCVGRHFDPGAVRRRGAREHGVVARGVPGEPAAAGIGLLRHRPVRAGVPRPRCVLAFRLAGLGGDRAGGGRAGVRHDPRTAARLGRTHRDREPGDRGDRGDRVPLHDAAPAAPARAPATVPVEELHGDEPVDAGDLRRPVRLPDLPGDLPDRHPGLQRAGGGRRGDPLVAAAGAVLDAVRQARRAARSAAVHGDRPGDHGPRPPVAGEDPVGQRTVDPGRGRGVSLPAAGRLLRGHPAGAARLRHGPHDHGRAAHDRPDDVGAREQRGCGLGDQQRHLPGRLPARDRGDLRRGRLQLLRLDLAAGPRGERRLERVPRPGRSLEPTLVRHVAADPSRGPFGVDGRLPPGRARFGRPARGGCRDQRGGDPQPVGEPGAALARVGKCHRPMRRVPRAAPSAAPPTISSTCRRRNERPRAPLGRPRAAAPRSRGSRRRIRCSVEARSRRP